MNGNQEEFNFTAEGDESGYRKWQKENTSRPPKPSEEVQEFDFAAATSEDGYRQWQADQAATRLAFERRWNLRLGCQVRIEVSALSKPLVGRISLSTNKSKNLEKSKEPLLKIGTFEFFPSEIISLVVIDSDL